MSDEYKICLIMPFYNHETLVDKMIESLDSQGLPCFIVNDGSKAEALPILEDINKKYDWTTVIHLKENQGKGAAVIKGFHEAQKAGFTHALQIDADCQHDINDIKKFISESKDNPTALIVGQAVYGDDVPKSRLYGRWITHFWVMIETLRLKKIDTMCGFRIYPLGILQKINLDKIGKRMDFDIEIAVKLCWQNCPLIPIPTHVNYPDDGVSHFHYLKGNLRISWMHTKLFFGMLIRLPLILKRKCCG